VAFLIKAIQAGLAESPGAIFLAAPFCT